MAQETIDIIRQAELAAEQTEKNAISEAEAIVSNAKEKAQEIISGLISEASDNAKQALASAAKQGETIMDDTKRQLELELAALRQSTDAKRSQAVEFILSQLF